MEVMLLYLFFVTPVLIYGGSWVVGTFIFRVIFLHERCHQYVHYMFRKNMEKRTDCVILLNEDKYKSLSESTRKRIKKIMHKRNMRAGLRSSEERVTQGTCYVPFVDYHKRSHYFLEAFLSLVAPYYGCTWQAIPFAFVFGLLEDHFLKLSFGVTRVAVIYLLGYLFTPVLLVLLDPVDKRKQVSAKMESFFSELSTRKSRDEIEKCLLSSPPVSDAYKLRHLRWSVDTEARRRKILEERCNYCGIPYFDTYSMITEKLNSGTYVEL